jgi:hypothetical protein
MDQIDLEEIKKYLNIQFNGEISEVSINELGAGCVGTGYGLDFKVGGVSKRKILKTLFTSNLGMDHFSDRAGSLLLAHSHYHKVPKHVESVDVCGVSEDGAMISVGKAKEFFILMDEAKGKDMFSDFERIAKEDNLSEIDKKRILELSNYLVELHEEKPTENQESLYKRTMRGVVGGHTSIMSIVDMYPSNQDWVSSLELQEMIKESVKFWSEHRFSNSRLCHVHGDFHPGNIWYNEDDFTLLDRSGMTYGEAADDMTAFSINFLFYSYKEHGVLKGAAKEGFELFWNNYLEKSGDLEIKNVAPPFFALRSMVVINPIFYSDDFFGGKDNADKVRKGIFNFALEMLKEGKFTF